MSWIMKAKIVYMEQLSVYAENKEFMKLTEIRYKWEVV